MKRIDPHQGPRAALFAHFRAFAVPHFTLASPLRVDVARLKAEGGLFPNLLHAAMAAANEVPALRQRLRVERDDDGVEHDVIVEHEVVHCTCTTGREDGSFTFGYFPYTAEREAFVAEVPGRLEAAAARPGLDLGEQHRDDMLYLSTVPWVPITGVVHAWQEVGGDSIPRVLWGRADEGRLTVSLTAHHALVDGLHVARFFRAMEARIA